MEHSRYFNQGTKESRTLGYENDTYDLYIKLKQGEVSSVKIHPYDADDTDEIIRQLMADLTQATLNMEFLFEVVKSTGKYDEEGIAFISEKLYGKSAETSKKR